MTWEETLEVVDWMTVRWTDVARWGDERIHAFYSDLGAWPKDGVDAVLRGHYEDGNARAPTGGQVIKLLRSFGYQRNVEQESAHKHVWAIEEFESERTDGLRLASCVVSGCETEKTFSPSALRTPGEWDEHAKEKIG